MSGVGPPRHPDGSPVITDRLYRRLSRLERLWYSGDPIVARLVSRVQWLTGGEPVDGWDPEDFVSYGLEKVAQHPGAPPGAVSTWVRQEVVRRRSRTDRIRFDELEEQDEPADEYRPTRLSDQARRVIDEVLPARSAQAVRLYAEAGLTPTEAAGTVGISRTKFYEALHTLKGHLG